ncbi:MAG: S8 family serine peptidase, partial [Planctomycetales bacterium]|nr:S8 family serine peptidase [Planctomycetales bacterium]
DGDLSFFSQRHQRVIAAPGRAIISTVPDYAGDGDGLADDFASYSGTSMATPYVTGASVLIREAFDFAGQPDVSQQQIYQLMRDTGDQVWDDDTGAFYTRLNLAAALNAIMPIDEYGSTAAAAYDLGVLG